MRLLCLFLAAVTLAPAQITDTDPPPVVLPSGKLQRDEIIKLEHQRNLEDAAQLVRLSQEVKDDLDQKGEYVLSIKTLKKLDDIDKLTKNLRSRMKRN
jgi:hypothetical protein